MHIPERPSLWRVTVEVLVELDEFLRPDEVTSVVHWGDAADAAAAIVGDILERGIAERVGEQRGIPLDGDEIRTTVPFCVTTSGPFYEDERPAWDRRGSLA